MFNQHAFNRFVIDNSVVGFFEKPVVLKSGRTSNWYVNWRKVSNDVFLLEQLAQQVNAFLTDLVDQGKISAPECIYGVPEGATKLGILVQYLSARTAPGYGKGSHVLAMGRGNPKQHGAPEDRFFVGMPRGGTVVLEDVTTTGGSLLTTIDALNEAGVEVLGAVGLTNRMERRDDGASVLEAIGAKRSGGRSIPYFHMSSACDLLPEICRKDSPSVEVMRSIEAEFLEFGVQPVKLLSQS